MSWQPPSEQPSGWRPPPPPTPPGTWPPAPPPQWGAPPPTENSGKAIAALVCGIAGIFVCPLVGSIVALVLGYQARGEIDRSGGQVGGRGMAVGGIVLGWVGIALGVLWIALIVFVIVVGVAEESIRTEPDFTYTWIRAF